MMRPAFSFLVLFLIAIPARALAAPPWIDSFDVLEAPRGARVRIVGSDLGDPATSRVEIGGRPAPTARWTSTGITAYVPVGARIGETSVRVVTPEGADARLITILPSTPVDDRIAWRVTGDGSGAGHHAPGVRRDGTVIVGDGGGFVYAIDREGVVRWIVDAARALDVEWAAADRGPIAVGHDDVAYVAITSGTEEHVLAIDRDGATAWARTFESGFLSAGPSIGPEGDVYVLNSASWVVSTDPPGPSSGMMRLRHDDGATVWATRGDPVITQVPFEGAPIVFGASTPGGAIDRAFVFAEQGALSTSPGDPQRDALRGFALDDGRETFVALTLAPSGSASPLQVWPAVRDDGAVLVSSFVSSSVGQRVRFAAPSSGAFVGMTSVEQGGGLGSPLAGRDGRTFVIRDQSWLDAFDVEGRLVWERRVAGGPRPNRLVFGADRSAIWIASPGRAIAVSAEDGALVDDVSVPASSGTETPVGCALGTDDVLRRVYYVGCFATEGAGWELSAIQMLDETPANDDAGVAPDAGMPTEADAGAMPAMLPSGSGCSVGARAAHAPWALLAMLALLLVRRAQRPASARTRL
ncbi:IPT/TIG domain-containing protein [Sandaracinus amylolyticus]|uniref:Cell surface protein n=1 Tax=Sandaracinus amylolyticus TaxID=927083 RepID=A0A0F6SFP0_9BACT|nr:IPT/TIG domain-containing protein [Sandaracinus amylolyticus]AKF07279.1 Cell surface protein [Sandaracinus amylolyticus]